MSYCWIPAGVCCCESCDFDDVIRVFMMSSGVSGQGLAGRRKGEDELEGGKIMSSQ